MQAARPPSLTLYSVDHQADNGLSLALIEHGFL